MCFLRTGNGEGSAYFCKQYLKITKPLKILLSFYDTKYQRKIKLDLLIIFEKQKDLIQKSLPTKKINELFILQSAFREEHEVFSTEQNITKVINKTCSTLKARTRLKRKRNGSKF